MEAKFQLIRVSDKTVVASGTSYGRAELRAQQLDLLERARAEDAEDRAAKVIGEDLKSRLSAYLAGSRPNARFSVWSRSRRSVAVPT